VIFPSESSATYNRTPTVCILGLTAFIFKRQHNQLPMSTHRRSLAKPKMWISHHCHFCKQNYFGTIFVAYYSSAEVSIATLFRKYFMSEIPSKKVAKTLYQSTLQPISGAPDNRKKPEICRKLEQKKPSK
jgi:hypothetical protein